MATNLTEFEKLVAIDVLGCPSELLTYQTRQAVIEFCSKSHALNIDLNFTISSGDIQSSINDYVDFDFSSYLSSERPVTVLRLNIDGSDWNVFRKNIAVDVTYLDDIKAEKTKYFDFIDDTTLRVFDIDSNNTEFYFQIALKPTQAATSVNDDLHEDWVEPIVAGAKYRLLSMPNKPWMDLKAANHNFTLFRRGISEAKVKVNKGFSNRPSMVKPQIFGQPHW